MVKFHFPKSSSKNAVIAHPLQFSVSFQGQMVKEGIKREEEKERKQSYYECKYFSGCIILAL